MCGQKSSLEEARGRSRCNDWASGLGVGAVLLCDGKCKKRSEWEDGQLTLGYKKINLSLEPSRIAYKDLYLCLYLPLSLSIERESVLASARPDDIL